MWLQWSPVKPSHPSCFQLCYPLHSKSKHCDLNFQTLQTKILFPSHNTNMLLFKYIYCISSRNSPTELCSLSPHSQLVWIWLLGPLFPSFHLSSSYLCFPRYFRQFLLLHSSDHPLPASLSFAKRPDILIPTTFLFWFMHCLVLACFWGQEGDWILGFQLSHGSSFSQKSVHTRFPWNQVSQRALVPPGLWAMMLQYTEYHL